jgi:ABC-2 type transport system permease protein
MIAPSWFLIAQVIGREMEGVAREHSPHPPDPRKRLMSKILLVALYEYRRTVFKKTFILALMSVPLMIGLNIGVGLLMESLDNDNSPVGYIDHAGLLVDPLPPMSGSSKPVPFVRFDSEPQAKAALDRGEIQAYYVVAADYMQTGRVDLVYLEEPGRNAASQFRDLIQVNLAAGEPAEIARRAALIDRSATVRSLDGSRQLPGGGPTFAIIMPLLITIAFLVLVLMSSGYLMEALADEKENRTIEVLITSTSPSQLVGGKVLGIVAIGLTQLAAWTGVTVLGILVARQAGIEWFQDLTLDWGTVVASVTIAVPAFVLASALMTAVGILISSSQEGQSIAAMLALLHFLLPLLAGWAIINTPDALLPTLLSLLPFTALMTISLRNIFAVVPAWQVAAGVAVQTVCAVCALWLAGRAFRFGMLRYGQRLRWRELLQGSPR